MSKIEIQNQMFTMVEQCHQSGLSRREYCAVNNMNEARFYYWQKKYKDIENASSGFIKLATESGSKSSGTIEILFPNGVRIAADLKTTRSDLNKIVSCW